ncbi:MAG: hypothetical protein II438_02445 [Clostridiales bacterium]|nr:hypothetical protein [Clostridiales bacterium]
MNKIKPRKIWIIYGIVFAAFVCMGVFAGLHHEPWADEAQSWLIARDNNNLIDLLKAVKYEGTLPTWHLINKAFQLAGLDYDHMFVIPLVFSAIGVILLFFTDAPLWSKIMLPFSFFVVYQNSVVARQYAMVFPAMMLIVIFYRKRFDVPVRYHLALFLLALTSSFGVVISCSFMLWDFIIMLKKRFEGPAYKKYLLPFFGTGIVILVMSYLSLPPDDCSTALNKYSLSKNATNALLFNIENTALRYIFLALMLALFVYYFRRILIQSLVMTAPLIIFMAVVYQREWHMTYLFFLLVSLLMIFRDDFKKTERPFEKPANVLANIMVVMLLAVQCAAGVYSVYYEHQHAYSPAKEIAEFLRPYAGEGAVIDREGFNAIALSPYYDQPLYTNDTCGKAYFIWSYNVPNDKLTKEYPDVFVTFRYYEKFGQDYDVYKFDSHMIFKFGELETEPYIVYIKKNI